LGGLRRVLVAGVAVCAVAYVPVASAAMIDIHASGLTPASYTKNVTGGGTLTVDVTNNFFTTKVGANAASPAGAGSFDLNITFNPVSNNGAATLANAGGTGFGFKVTAPGPQTVTAAFGTAGITWMLMSGNTYITIPSYLVNSSAGVGNLLIQINSFDPGSQITTDPSHPLTLQADVYASTADVPLPNTATASIVLLSGTGAWAALRRRQLA